MSATIAIISIASFFLGQVLVTRRCFIGFLVWAVSNLLVATSLRNVLGTKVRQSQKPVFPILEF